MSRNIIKLAGGTYTRLKGLSGSEALHGREVVLTTDTNELYVGKGDGTYHLLGNTIFGGSLSEIQETDPLEGRYFYDSEKGNLYLANGTGWKKVGVSYDVLRGLGLDDTSGELYIKVDEKFIIFDEQGRLTLGNTDYGEF